MEQKFQGISAVVLTPFNVDDKIDYSTLGRLIELMLRKGIHSLFPCSSFSLGSLIFKEGKLDQVAKLQQKILKLVEILSMGQKYLPCILV